MAVFQERLSRNDFFSRRSPLREASFVPAAVTVAVNLNDETALIWRRMRSLSQGVISCVKADYLFLRITLSDRRLGFADADTVLAQGPLEALGKPDVWRPSRSPTHNSGARSPAHERTGLTAFSSLFWIPMVTMQVFASRNVLHRSTTPSTCIRLRSSVSSRRSTVRTQCLVPDKKSYFARHVDDENGPAEALVCTRPQSPPANHQQRTKKRCRTSNPGRPTVRRNFGIKTLRRWSAASQRNRDTFGRSIHMLTQRARQRRIVVKLRLTRETYSIVVEPTFFDLTFNTGKPFKTRELSTLQMQLPLPTTSQRWLTFWFDCRMDFLHLEIGRLR